MKGGEERKSGKGDRKGRPDPFPPVAAGSGGSTWSSKEELDSSAWEGYKSSSGLPQEVRVVRAPGAGPLTPKRGKYPFLGQPRRPSPLGRGYYPEVQKAGVG